MLPTIGKIRRSLIVLMVAAMASGLVGCASTGVSYGVGISGGSYYPYRYSYPYWYSNPHWRYPRFRPYYYPYYYPYRLYPHRRFRPYPYGFRPRFRRRYW